MDIQQCRNQQADILRILKKIEEHCHQGSTPISHELAQAAVELESTVKAYIAEQDPILYPPHYTGQFIAHIAHRYRNEMAHISLEFLRFSERWNQAEKIALSPMLFYNDAKPIFEALKYRIQRESTELYPKIEQLLLVK